MPPSQSSLPVLKSFKARPFLENIISQRLQLARRMGDSRKREEVMRTLSEVTWTACHVGGLAMCECVCVGTGGVGFCRVRE